jgi:hypothetical protein
MQQLFVYKAIPAKESINGRPESQLVGDNCFLSQQSQQLDIGEQGIRMAQ